MDELYGTVIEAGDCLLMDKLLYMYKGDRVDWTVPSWAKTGDIVFFMHSKTSNSHLTAIRTEFEQRAGSYSDADRLWLKYWINHALDVHRQYGGKIFAIGRVAGKPRRETFHEYEHWASTIYADIDDIFILSDPVDISEFNDVIYVSRQGAITGVFGEQYYELMSRIEAKNSIPKMYRNLNADPLPFSKIDESNWFDVVQRYRCSFFLEKQFRSYCVNYFLKEFGDQKTFYSEARCMKRGKADTFVDNLVKFKGKWLPVEVKLNITLEHNLSGQILQYLNVDSIYVEKERALKRNEIWLDRIMVVDTEGIYIFKDATLKKLLAWQDMGSCEELINALNLKLCGWYSWR